MWVCVCVCVYTVCGMSGAWGVWYVLCVLECVVVCTSVCVSSVWFEWYGGDE